MIWSCEKEGRRWKVEEVGGNGSAWEKEGWQIKENVESNEG